MSTILVTGSTDGIGLETVKALVGLGHQVLIHGRSLEKLQKVSEQLNSIPSAKPVRSFHADFSDLNAVKAMADDILEANEHLDVIINNAGILKTNEPITCDGWDVRFVVNTIAPYLLTRLLKPALSTGSRVVNLSSAAQESVSTTALRGEIFLDDHMRAYSQSKLAITMWSRQLASQWQDLGIVVVAVNPGSLLASKMVKEGFGITGNNITQGSDILVTAALSPTFATASGLYFDNDSRAFAAPNSDALNDEKCNTLVDTLDQLLSDFL